MTGQPRKAVADFDRYLASNPAREPYHWQRGIAHYYAEMFEAGRRQFESHQQVNSNDVENAVWHFLCVARLEGLEAARRLLIPIEGDPRIPMAEVHRLFSGTGTPEDVLRTAQAGEPAPDAVRNRLCYAHLYLGLYAEALGDAKQSARHIEQAATTYQMPHYMGQVARAHRLLRSAAPAGRPDGEAPAQADSDPR
jgi:lipoprotein NlpI